jgi:hypothetical protein
MASAQSAVETNSSVKIINISQPLWSKKLSTTILAHRVELNKKA